MGTPGLPPAAGTGQKKKPPRPRPPACPPAPWSPARLTRPPPPRSRDTPVSAPRSPDRSATHARPGSAASPRTSPPGPPHQHPQPSRNTPWHENHAPNTKTTTKTTTRPYWSLLPTIMTAAMIVGRLADRGAGQQALRDGRAVLEIVEQLG